MDRKTVQAVAAVALIAAVAVMLLLKSRDAGGPGAPGPDDAAAPADPSVHLALGNPSRAADDESRPDNFLMRKPYFALSYNNAAGGPNWVSWCLRADDLGPAARTQFHPDSDLPAAFKHVLPRDYTSGGFDRGHMCPRSDRTNTPEAATATFVMTNIIPQAPHVNQRAWADLEDYCRSLVRGGRRTLYVVAGPQGVGGIGSEGPADSIAGGKVTVPAKCWKVIVVVDGGAGGPEDAGRVTVDTRAIAVVMPNDQTVGHGWGAYRVSVRAVEELTGYTFLSRVPATVAGPLKDRVDDAHVSAGAGRRGED